MTSTLIHYIPPPPPSHQPPALSTCLILSIPLFSVCHSKFSPSLPSFTSLQFSLFIHSFLPFFFLLIINAPLMIFFFEFHSLFAFLFLPCPLSLIAYLYLFLIRFLLFDFPHLLSFKVSNNIGKKVDASGTVVGAMSSAI